MKFKLFYILLLISISIFSQVNLGDDINACEGDTITLDATTNNATAYQWFFNGVQINGENQATYNVTEIGLYKVEVIVNGVMYEDEVNANFNPLPVANSISYIECDNDGVNDGITDLDLSQYAQYITDDTLNNTVNFYLTFQDSQNNINSIATPYTINNSQFFYIRVENTLTNCVALSDFIISIYTNPTSLDTLTACETDGNGFEMFDLNTVNATAINTIDFYVSNADAENEVNQLPVNYTNTSNPQTIFAKITNNLGCTYIATVALEVFDKPIINTPSNLESCHVEFDGYVFFDLSVKNNEILNGLDSNIYQVTYHPSQYSADNNLSAISSYYQNENTTLYVRLENTVTGCFATTTLEVIINQEQITNPTDLAICDANNDGFELFDLTTKSAEILNGSSSIVIYYENYYDAFNNVNPIVNAQAYNNTAINQTIYAKAENTDGCLSNIVNFQLKTSNPLITIGGDYFLCFNESSIVLNPGFNPALYDLEWRDENNNLLSTQNAYLVNTTGTYYLTVTHETTNCSSTVTINVVIADEFIVNTPNNLSECIDNNTGLATFDLTSVENQLGISLVDYAISYHEGIDYAEAGINAISNTQMYTSNLAELYVWIRIVDIVNDCADVVPLITNALDCNDNDNDGVPNYEEDLNHNGDLTDDDTDFDTIPNYLDSDDDGDNVDTSVERTATQNRNPNVFIDTDNDLIENYLDDDDDGDGVLTINEDYNNNGDPTDDDTNFNGIPDYLENSVALNTENNNFEMFAIYPNPVTSILNIDFKQAITNATITVFTINGQIVIKETLTDLHSKIELNQLNKGVYILKIELDKRVYLQKLMKQ